MGLENLMLKKVKFIYNGYLCTGRVMDYSDDPYIDGKGNTTWISVEDSYGVVLVITDEDIIAVTG